MFLVLTSLFIIFTSAYPLNGWEKQNRATSQSQHTLSFWLHPENPDALESKFWKVSDPDHPSFRQYLSNAEIVELVKPKSSAITEVRSWALEVCPQAVLEASQFGDFLKLTSHVDCLERLLSQNFHHYTHPKSQRIIIGGTKTFEIPARLNPFVRYVFGLVEFFPIVKRKQYEKTPGDEITPPIIREYYNVHDKVNGESKSSQGIAAFEDAEFKQTDLELFLKTYNLTSLTIDILGPNDGGYFGEATLDTQYILATGENIKTWFLSQEQFDLLSWSQMVMNMTSPPSVLSISWGSGESGFILDHMQAANAEFMKMGLKGISILTASGDDGTGKQGMFRCSHFDTNWPASSPYLTTVGGTYSSSGSEIGWSDSGGGFSSIFAQPSYQKEAVSTYLSTARLPSSNLFNSSGRALPDISTFATNFRVYSSAWSDISGTSAASPTLAGMIASINEALLSNGQAVAGFLNPALYKHAESIVGFDVVDGNNKHSGCPAGFPCVKGWDAVTGMGTPNFQKLKQVLLNGP